MKFSTLIQYYRGLTVPEAIYLFFRNYLAPYDYLESLIPKKGLIVDFGCGAGIFSLLAYLKNQKREIIGMEIDRNKLILAGKISNTSIHFKKINLRIDKEIDCLVILDVLCVLTNDQQNQLFNNASKILKKDGRIVINTNFRDSSLGFRLTELSEYFFVELIRSTYSQDKKTNYMNFKSFESRVKKHGFKIILKKRLYYRLFYPHDIIVLQKSF